MKVLVKVDTRVLDSPPGLAVGKYLEVTTAIHTPVNLIEHIIPAGLPPSVSVTIYGPIEPERIEEAREQIVTAERKRITDAYQSIIIGC